MTLQLSLLTSPSLNHCNCCYIFVIFNFKLQCLKKRYTTCLEQLRMHSLFLEWFCSSILCTYAAVANTGVTSGATGPRFWVLLASSQQGLKLKQFCMNFIARWSNNGSFQALRRCQQHSVLLVNVLNPILLFGC